MTHFSDRRHLICACPVWIYKTAGCVVEMQQRSRSASSMQEQASSAGRAVVCFKVSLRANSGYKHEV